MDVQPLLCEKCRAHQASHICKCGENLLPLCDQCEHEHEEEECLDPHLRVSVKAWQQCKDANYFPNLTARQQGVKDALKSISLIFEQINDAEHIIERFCEELLSTIAVFKEEKLRELREVKRDLEAKRDVSMARVKDCIYKTQFHSESALEWYIWNYSANPGPLRIFQFAINDFAVKQALQASVHSSVDYDVSPEADPCLYHPTRTHLLHWDSRLHSWLTPIPLSLSLNVTKESSWCSLPPSLLFICGGYRPPSTSAYLVTKDSGIVEELPPMSTSRANHGIIAVDNEVLIFGGHSENPLRSCESFQLNERKWVQLADMHEDRGLFNPCRSGRRVFIIGGHCAREMEWFDLDTRTFVQCNLPTQLIGHTTAFTFSNEMFILQCYQFYKVRVSEEGQVELLKTDTGRTNYHWSNCPVLVKGNNVFIMCSVNNAVVHVEMPDVRVVGTYGFLQY